MANRTIKGKNMLLLIASAPALDPVAVFDSAVNLSAGLAAGEGLDYISSITNEPTNLYQITSATTASFNFKKEGERKHYISGADQGTYIEANGMASGNCAIDKLIADYRYEAGFELLKKAAFTENQTLYVKALYPLDIAPTTAPAAAQGKYIYEVKAGLFVVSVDAQNDATAKTTTETFTFEGSGFYANGYVALAA